MKLRLFFVPLFAFALGAAPVSGDENKKILDAFQGEWAVTKILDHGAMVPDTKDFTITFVKDRMVNNFNESKPRGVKIDTAKTPMEIDLFEGDVLMGRGIFELDGDNLKMCLGGAKTEGTFNKQGLQRKITVDDRPSKFDSALATLIELKRAKK